MASRLEGATKQYGVPILISHYQHSHFSKKVKKICREIDRVTVKGSNNPVGLFTVDISLKGIESQTKTIVIGRIGIEEKRLKHKTNKDLLKCILFLNCIIFKLIIFIFFLF